MQNVLVGQDVSATEILGGLDSFAAVGDDQVLPFQWTRSRLPSLLTSHPKQFVAVRQPRALRTPVPPPSTRFHGPHVTASAGAFAGAFATAGLAAARTAAGAMEVDVGAPGAADATNGLAADSAATTAHARPNVNTLRRLTKAP
jgi:hypothetical protein